MHSSKLKVALLAGGKSAEREVSLKSGEQVYLALDKERYEVLRYDPRDDLARLAREADRIDVALIILHGRLGEDGTVQGFLDLLGIPYQGSGVLGSAVAMNKILSKQLYVQAGLPVAPFAVMDRRGSRDSRAVVKELGLPLVVKPEHEGSSIGLSIVHDAADLAQALEVAWQYDRLCLLEKYLDGVEITGAVLGNDALAALPLIEIVPGKEYEFFDYKAKYLPGATQEICPARITPELAAKAQAYAKQAHQTLYCRGYSRTDMIVSGNDIFVLETNTIPGMTETSLFPQAAAAAGISFSSLLDRLIELALEK
ncbi:D-alanine--D-alanine ligase family protein [Desulfoferrobacter suflitae]|uniref:D-alanine--D-alanine ligase family protein n=1 Tax=Desulfoferrobacter suflitae TaxID=2865782 RepID=UPI00216420FA|nr:D-alanine--D-alanine ligase [Desulfoferrobacter suflitae]MCK8602058.1 D-alanine--D-alanine ligase [Desulfoferrobacter suflitae]